MVSFLEVCMIHQRQQLSHIRNTYDLSNIGNNLKRSQMPQNISVSGICGWGIHTSNPACTSFWLILLFSLEVLIKPAW